ncbi:MAG: DNA translocase FtsK [Dehalococcoidia bacterium]
MSLGRVVARPEIIGTALVVLAAAAIPYLLPLTGIFGAARDALVALFGLHVFTVIGLLAGLGVLLAMHREYLLKRHRRHVGGLLVFLVFVAGLLGLWHPETRVGEVNLAQTSAGGMLGALITTTWWSTLAWAALLPISYALLWPRTALRLAREAPPATWRTLRWMWGLGLHRHAGRGVVAVYRRTRGAHGEAVLERVEVDAPEPEPVPLETVRKRKAREAELAAAVEQLAPLPEPVVNGPTDLDGKPVAQLPMDMETPVSEWRHAADGWQLPPLKLLKKVEVKAKSGPDNKRRADLITQTLASFGVDASVVEINEGPTVTQFGVEPGWDVKTRMVTERDATGRAILDPTGNARQNEVEVARTRIRVNRITALQNDLALALAAPALRIEAPVPGKPMVGIEVPNGTTSVVSLRSMMESDDYQKFASKAALPIALGAGVSGDPVTADLARMPHLLIAGATGAGKSVCLNTIITGLLMNYSPEQLRFVMVDPKRVELTAFSKIPHLAFSEIVVEMDRVVGTLQAVINEMETRYRRFAQVGVRNIEAYNKKPELGRPLPYWCVVIDELADLMLAAPYQVEQQLVRLAQLARATGIHLVVATQRPSVDVITGLIKANFPTRIAFAVSSQIDSRTILDQGGAEKLLGKGDMLYVPPDAQKPKRVQGVYVSDEEIESVVNFWTADRFKSLRPEKYDHELERALEQAESLGSDGSTAGDDPMLEKAIDVAKQSRTLSTSMLQRKLGIGYPRAAKVMDLLEERGVVGPGESGGKPRNVLISEDGPVGGVDAEESSLAAHAAAFVPRKEPPAPFDAE